MIPASGVDLPDNLKYDINEQFWRYEVRAGYEQALELTADHFGVSCAEVEAVIIEYDALNNGN